MYCSSRDEDFAALKASGHDRVLFHTSDYRKVVRHHRSQVAGVFNTAGAAGLADLGRVLMPRIADTRTMRYAVANLDRGAAPGPDGLRLDMLDDGETWSLCRQLARAVRQHNYVPGPERKHLIPKEGKPGKYRELTIQCAADRIVGKALLLILGPIFEPVSCPFSMGFRPRRGPVNALATAIALAESDDRLVWVSADIAQAFDAIPHHRFLDACRKHFPEPVSDFIRLISYTGQKRGLRQGSPASPLFANIFFDRNLDHPWHEEYPDTPLVRYADDLLVPARNMDEARGYSETLARLARSAGTPLKGNVQTSIHDLAAGVAVDWLGFHVERRGDNFVIGIGSQARAHLLFKLQKAHLKSNSPIRAAAIVAGWIVSLGPCYMTEDRHAVIEWVHSTAKTLAFDEIPSQKELLEQWSAAHARWCHILLDQRQKLQHRQHILEQWLALHPEPANNRQLLESSLV